MEKSLSDRIVELGEERLQKLMQEITQNPRVLKALGDAIKTGGQARDSIVGALKGISQMLNLPGMEDLHRLETALAELGEKLSDTESRIEKLAAALAGKVRAKMATAPAAAGATVKKVVAVAKKTTKKPAKKTVAAAKRTTKKTANSPKASARPAAVKKGASGKKKARAKKRGATNKPAAKKKTAPSAGK